MDCYKVLLSNLKDFLKIKGFSKKGDSFYISNHDNWGIINFQKSTSNSVEMKSFTINIGVFSTKIEAFMGTYDAKKISVWDCHWRNRIGLFLPEKKDYWWKIDSQTSIEVLYNEIVNIIDAIIIPNLNKYLSDENIKSNWLDGNSDGVTELQRYLYLTILLKLSGDPLIYSVVDELRAYAKGRPFEYTAKEHIIKLRL